MNIMIVDDEQLIREGLSYLLDNFDDIDVVAQASNGEEALALCAYHAIDIVLMDMRMPVMDGATATLKIKEKYPHIKILILTTFKDDESIKQSLNNGASGYLLKNSSAKLIHTSLNTVSSGGVVIDNAMAQEAFLKGAPQGKPADFELTEREMQMIQMIADGLSNKSIGEALFLTEGTVKNAITQLLLKLDLKDRTQIVSFAFRNGLIQ